MFKLSSYLKKYKKLVIIGPAIKLLETVFDILTPILVALILDDGIPNNNKPFIVQITIIIVVMNLLGFACAIGCSKCSALVSKGVGQDVRRDMYKHITSLSRTEKDKFTTMALTNRVVHDVQQVEMAISMTIRLISRAPFLLIGSTIATFIIDAKLALIFVVLMPVLLFTVLFILKKMSPLYFKAKLNLDKISNVTRENLSGNRVIRAFNKQEYEKQRFTKVNDQYTGTNFTIGKISAILQPLLYLFVNLGVIAVVYFGGIRVNIGGLTQGKIISFINYFTQISMSLIVIARLIIIFTRTGASIKRINEVYKLTPSIKNSSKAIVFNEEEPANIKFNNISFSYNNVNQLLAGLTLDIPAGSTIGIIGGTGSGKSTLVNLLPRFYDVSSGEILLNDVNIKKYNLESLRNVISIVPQNPTLFKGTIESNLKFRKQTASHDELVKALKISQAYEFVMEKPDGLKTKVERGGVNFSGGQKQRLTIARAIVGNPKILILDDSSSALDFETDYKLRHALSVHLKNTTKIIVSQRINSIKHADKIVVLDNGNVVAIDDHSSLITSCDVYKEMYNSQNKKGVK